MFQEYERISESGDDDLTKTVEIVSIVNKMKIEDVLDLPLEKFKNLVGELNFLSELPVPTQPKDKYVINGHKYRLCLKPKDITAAQWVDFQAIDKKDYASLLSVFLIPEGKKYNDGYDIIDCISDFKSLPIPEVMSLVAFFFILYRAFTKALLAYSYRMTRKAKTPEAIQVRKKIKELMDSLSYS